MTYKVYYAHSIKLYGSEKEKRQLEALRNIINFEIVNPSVFKGKFTMGVYLENVMMCDMVVFTDCDGYISKGVYDEVNYARKLGLDVVYMRDTEFVKSWKIEMCDKNDYKHRHAKIIC